MTKEQDIELQNKTFKKPIVYEYVKDWYEKHKNNFNYELYKYFHDLEYQEKDDFYHWVNNSKNSIITLVNMHQFGYEVIKVKNFFVRLKNIDNLYCYLNYNKEEKLFYINSKVESLSVKTKFTKEFLKKNSFGWVFDCPGVEVEEVE